ncbi:MAG: carbohydrate kinase family protein [Treponema sp.]|nr:carbohydrate kinase family protein [Treponema sp.]
MNNILISGLINIETTIKIKQFPIVYAPIDYPFFGVHSTVSGVGYNIAKAIKTLGGNPALCSIIGNDIYKSMIESELESIGVNKEYVVSTAKETAQSAILYDKNKRYILLDLKDIQETRYPQEKINEILPKTDMAIVCNINFSRDMLKTIKEAGKTIATDVHVLNNINDEYNKDFMEYSDILFLSNENVIGKEYEFMQQLKERYHQKILVMGMGEKGALLSVREKNTLEQYPAVKTRAVINTIGAGDALFSSFIYFYNKTQDPYYAIEKATLFASYKIGERGAAQGFLTEAELLKINQP